VQLFPRLADDVRIAAALVVGGPAARALAEDEWKAVVSVGRLRRRHEPPRASVVYDGSSGNGQGLYSQANVLQFANVVLALSPMNSVADQISPVGSANEAL
jgi:hypothetical protein